MKTLAPLKEKVHASQKGKDAAMHTAARARGPVRHQLGHVTQAEANEWVPPGGHMHLDTINARWRIKWEYGQVSRSFGAHGFEESCLLCLRLAWRSHTYFTGLECTVPGIFESADARAADMAD
eukprot:8225657-Heterocapsa_arctica.AAC.1